MPRKLRMEDAKAIYHLMGRVNRRETSFLGGGLHSNQVRLELLVGEDLLLVYRRNTTVGLEG